MFALSLSLTGRLNWTVSSTLKDIVELKKMTPSTETFDETEENVAVTWPDEAEEEEECVTSDGDV